MRITLPIAKQEFEDKGFRCISRSAYVEWSVRFQYGPATLCDTCPTWHMDNMLAVNQCVKGAEKGRWSLAYDFCVRCGRNDRPYLARGLCSACYSVYKRSGKLPTS